MPHAPQDQVSARRQGIGFGAKLSQGLASASSPTRVSEARQGEQAGELGRLSRSALRVLPAGGRGS